MTKERYIKITMPDRSHFITAEFDCSMIDNLDTGQKATIEWVELTDEQYENLPDYEG
jgi:hypothetical protein